MSAGTLTELVSDVDLPSLVEQYAGPGTHRGGRWLFRCPNPAHEDRHPSFTVQRSSSGRWRARCWAQCSWAGDALDLIEWLEGVNRTEAIRKLRGKAGRPELPDRQRTPQPQRTTTQRPPTPTPAPDEVRTPPAAVADRILSEHLTARGWPREAADRYQLSVILDRWGRPRIRYPFHSWAADRWAVTAWQDRAAGDQKPKWLTSAGVQLPPYNLRALDTEHELRGLVICEGPADAITADLALRDISDIAAVGIAGAQGWRSEWAPMLTAAQHVIIAADPDEAGRTLVRAVVGSLRRAAVVLDLSAGDLTETARAHGLEAVTELLTAPISLGDMAATTEQQRTPRAVEAGNSSGLEDPHESYLRLLPLAAFGPCSALECSSCGRAALTYENRRCRITPSCSGRYHAPSLQEVSA